MIRYLSTLALALAAAVAMIAPAARADAVSRAMRTACGQGSGPAERLSSSSSASPFKSGIARNGVPSASPT